jgi:hypothetical protein
MAGTGRVGVRQTGFIAESSSIKVDQSARVGNVGWNTEVSNSVLTHFDLFGPIWTRNFLSFWTIGDFEPGRVQLGDTAEFNSALRGGPTALCGETFGEDGFRKWSAEFIPRDWKQHELAE